MIAIIYSCISVRPVILMSGKLGLFSPGWLTLKALIALQ